MSEMPEPIHLLPAFKFGDVSLFPAGATNDPLTRNMPFQTQDRFAFSPLPTHPLSIEGLALLLLIANFSRTPEGQKSLERLALKYLDSCATIISSVQDACHSNWLTALNNQHITAAISHRIGLIDDAGYLKIMSHYQSVFDKMFALSLISDTITGVTTLVQGAKVGGGTGGGTGGGEASGIGALATLLKVLPAAV